MTKSDGGDLPERKARHILSLSGGKDSAALAIYMRDRVSEMEYIFNDTRKELPETYQYLERIEDYLRKPIVRLNAELGFDHWYDVYGGMIPSNHRRWCTKMLKLKPFEDYVGDAPVLNYIGLRGDEPNRGYISHKANIIPVYPFRDDGLKLADIEEILKGSGVGMPPYTEWGRTRSGCYFCFYQQKIEWVRLKQRHPDLFEKAKEYERPYPGSGNVFAWSSGERLEDLERPERMAQIEEHARRRDVAEREAIEDLTLAEVYSRKLRAEAADPDSDACLICTL
jgi:3'-phosphoadenosine 5'-phosphosulfate sulfotransferase (PAPS reductase)/FAD synthetase